MVLLLVYLPSVFVTH